MIKHEYAELPKPRLAIWQSGFSVVQGVVFSYIFLVICFAILAVVYTYTAFPAGMLTPFTRGITAVSIILSGIIASRNIRGLGWLHGAFAGLLYSLIRIAAGMASGGPGENLLSVLLLGLALGAAGGIIGINLKK